MSDRIGSASIGLAVDSSGVDAGLNTMEATVTRTARSLSSLGRQGAQAVDGIASGASNAASQTERATRRIQNEIQRTTAVAQAGERGTRAFYEALANQRGANLNTLRPYLDQLEQVRTAQQAAAAGALRGSQAFNTQAQSAAQLANNLRGVPAQLTDIVTSLQGGQPALTVFLQQGGQLRDMFGSIGGAARALGGYLVSLVSPLTVTAAAVVALGVAYNQGSKEADAFRLAIIKSGNAAGVTASQLRQMAQQAAAIAGTQGANAEAIAALVSTGRVSADQLVRFSTVAVQAQKLLGTTVEDTAKAFADLGKDPLNAAKKLDEQSSFLTLSLYRQIKALTDQGRTFEAAKLAQNSYAESQERNTKSVQDNLGSLEKSWNAVAGTAKKAWDSMLDVGREDTLDDKIKKAQDNLRKANAAYLSFIGTKADKDADRDEAQRQLDRLQNIKKVGELTAQNDAEEKKRRDAAIQFDQDSEKSQSRRVQMEREIAQARNLGQQSAARGEDPAATEERIQKRIAQIRGSYADLLNQGIEGQIANIERLGAAQEANAQRALITLQLGQDAGFTQAADKKLAFMEAIAAADVAALQREKDQLRQRLALTAQEVTSEDGRAAQQQKLADLRSKIGLKDIEISTRRAQQVADATEEDVKANRAAFASLDALLGAREADTEALRQQLQTQNDQNAALGLSGQALADFNTKLVEERAVRLELRADILETIVGREEEGEQLRKQAQLMRDLNKAQLDGANKSKAIEANKSFWESVDKTAQSAFTSIFEGGKSAFDRLRDTLKAGLLDMLYQLTVKKWIISISTSVTGQSLTANMGSLLGVPGAGTLASGASPLSTAASFANIGKSVYDAVSTGFAGLATSLGSGIGALGNFIGSSTLSGFGTGLASTGYSAAGQAYLAQNVPGAAAGLSTAPLITAAAGIAAGVLGGRALSGGFSAFGGSGNSTVNLGTAIGTAILPGIGSLVGGLVGGLTNRLFGLKAPQIESQGIQGTISAGGVSGETFANILQKGGLFRSDKRSTSTAAIDSATDATFDKSVLAMVTAVKSFGQAIGEETANIDKYTKDFKLALTGDAAKDQELIGKLFTDVGEELATTLLPSIANLKKEGETAAAALQRLATDYVAMNAALGAIGINFGAVGASSLDAREKLLTLVGGLDNFVAQAEFFSQNFLSETERAAAVQKQLQAAFAELGVGAIPKTRDEFKALVQGLDLTTEGGRKMYAGLLGLQEAFASVTPQIDAAAEAAKVAAAAAEQAAKLAAEAAAKQKEQRALDIQLMEALGNSEGALAATRADALASLLSDQARITQAQIYAAQDAKKVYDSLVGVADGALSRLRDSVEAEKDRINAAYNTQAQAIRDAAAASVKSAQDSLKAAQDQASALQTVFGALNSALGSTKIQSDAATAARRQSAQAVLDAALKNPANIASNKALTDALSTITTQSSDRLFGTFEEYARDQARTNNTIAELRDAAGDQLDSASLTVARLEAAIVAIQDSGDKQLSQLESDNKDQIDKLDQQIVASTQQLDALKGINNSVLSLKDAFLAFRGSISNLASNPTATTNSNTVAVESLYQSLLGRSSDSEGIKFYLDALKTGYNLDQIKQFFIDSPEYKARQESMTVKPNPMQVSMDYYSQSLMQKYRDPAENSAALLAEVQRLNELTATQQVTLNAIAESTGIAGDVLDRAQKGQPLATSTEN